MKLAEVLAIGVKQFVSDSGLGGSQGGSCAPHLYVNGTLSYLFSMYTYGRVEIVFQYMKQFAMPFLGSEENRRELLKRLNEIPSVTSKTLTSTNGEHSACRSHMKCAWKESLITTDEAMSLGKPYACPETMRELVRRGPGKPWRLDVRLADLLGFQQKT